MVAGGVLFFFFQLFLDGEVKHDILPCELLVNTGKGVELSFDEVLVSSVEEDLMQLGAVDTHTQTAADDLCGEDHVLQDRIVHGSERARPGPLLARHAVLSRDL